MNRNMWDHWLGCKTPLSMCPRCLSIRKDIRKAKRHCPLIALNDQQELKV